MVRKSNGPEEGLAPLTSLIQDDAGSWERLRRGVAVRAAELTEEERQDLAGVLYPDLFSEYDARFLSRYVRSLGTAFSEEFRACEEAWERDEELHYRGFRIAYSALTGEPESRLEARMAAREADVTFEPLAALFQDEFTLACLVAYDELATVRAYRANMPSYRRLGPELVDFVRRVTGDEGRHYRNFFRLIRARHGHRLGELDQVLGLIRAHEGIPYGNTFVLDHDDDVWSEALFDDALDTLRRHLHA